MFASGSDHDLQQRERRAERAGFLIDPDFFVALPPLDEKDTRTKSIGRIGLGHPRAGTSEIARRLGFDPLALDSKAWLYSFAPDAPDVSMPVALFPSQDKSDYGHFITRVTDDPYLAEQCYRAITIARAGTFRARIQSECSTSGTSYGLDVVRPPTLVGTSSRGVCAQVTYNRSGFVRDCRCAHVRPELRVLCGHARKHLDAWMYSVARFLDAQFARYVELAKTEPSMQLCAFRPGEETRLYPIERLNFQRPLTPGGADTPLNLLPHGLAFKPIGTGWSTALPCGATNLKPGDRGYNAALLAGTFEMRVPPPDWQVPEEQLNKMVEYLVDNHEDDLAEFFICAEVDAQCDAPHEGDGMDTE
jgi:hypothetical protein